MTVQAILERKGTAVYTIEAVATIADVVRLLSNHNIGALLVTGADGLTVGIISERDIVRVLSDCGCAALDKLVAEVMTQTVYSCSRHDNVDDVMRRMNEGKLRHLPVVEEGRVVGIVSIRDAVELRLQQMAQDSAALRAYATSKLRSRQDALENMANLQQASFPKIF